MSDYSQYEIQVYSHDFKITANDQESALKSCGSKIGSLKFKSKFVVHLVSMVGLVMLSFLL